MYADMAIDAFLVTLYHRLYISSSHYSFKTYPILYKSQLNMFVIIG